MSKVAFLSLDHMGDFVCDDNIALDAFAAVGLGVDTVSWRSQQTRWADYAGVIVRSTWDYLKDPEAFLAALEDIDRQTRLANPLATIRWNIDKRYLSSLAADGIAIVPTEFGQGMDRQCLERLLDSAQGECVIKPVISGGADRTYRVDASASDARRQRIAGEYASSGWMWQPFLSQIVDEGEYSLFYFGGHYSHAILKTPKTGDFRVQEEFGGLIGAVAPEPSMRQAADRILISLSSTPLYARVDLVRDEQRGWLLIELELIEPSLYLRTDDRASERFAQAAAQWLA